MSIRTTILHPRHSFGFWGRTQEMEEKQNSKAFSCLMHYVILGVLSFFLFHLYNPRAIQESTMPWDYFVFNCFSKLIQLKLSLCSNYVFLILLSNIIICCLLVSSGLLSTPREARDLFKAYTIEGENMRVQIAAESRRIQKKYSVHQHERHDEVDYNYDDSIRKGGKKSMFAENERACEIYLRENLEEEYKWDETVAIVPVKSDEELKRRCDEFIAKFHRQMSLQSGCSYTQ